LSAESTRTLNKRRKIKNKSSSGRESQAFNYEEKFPSLITSKVRKRETAKDNLIITVKGNRFNKIREDSSVIKIAEINYEKCGKRLKIFLFVISYFTSIYKS
jgi:hypothetical protein